MLPRPSTHRLFFWSPRGGDAAQTAAEHLGALSGTDIERVSSLLLGKNAASAPEVQLVFLAEGLGTDAVRQHAARLPALDRLLQKSSMSLTVPFTTAHDAQLFSRTARVAGSQAVAHLKAHTSIFGNGVVDTVVVELPATGATAEEQLAAHDAVIESVTSAVDAGTRGNYAALLTAKRGAVSHATHRRLQATPSSPYLHTTPTLLTAQLIMLILMTIFLSGFCCLFSLQTPKRFEESKATAS